MSATGESADLKAASTYRISVDGHLMVLDRAELAVVEIRALFALDPHMDLIWEAENGPDRVLREDDVIALQADRTAYLYSRPPSSFG